jgi:phage shock protein C
MYCTNCGLDLGEKAAFCSQCGKPASAAAGREAPRAARAPLARIMSEKKIAGVCAGVARYFGVDVTMVRVVWLVLAICTIIPGFLAYLVAWIAMPKESGPPQSATEVAVTHP